MALTVTHTKVSAIPDVGNAALVEPSDWNASHTISGTSDVVVNTTVITSGTTTRFLYDNSATVGEALIRYTAANLFLGDVDAASPVAQTLSVQNVSSGTSNTAGADLSIAGSKGTGTGVGGSIILKTAPAGSTGTSQNSLATTMEMAADGR